MMLFFNRRHLQLWKNKNVWTSYSGPKCALANITPLLQNKHIKMKHKYNLAVAALLPFTIALAPAASAQTLKTPMPVQQKKYILVESEPDTHLEVEETLSGIKLYPAKKGTFQLDLEQKLKDDGLLKITNTAGKLVYHKPVSMASRKKGWHYNLGRLRPDIYLIEVITSNTTYWTKFKIN